MSEQVLPVVEERVVHTLSPEERRKDALKPRPRLRTQVASRLGPGSKAWEIAKRVLIGAYNDGFIHAGNLAYMAIISIFPFFILGAAIFSALGEDSERTSTITAILYALPPIVGEVIEPVARNVLEGKSGWVLWVGALVALWTVSSLIETIRDILRRAYGTKATHAFWKYRLFSAGVIFGAVVLLIASLIAQEVIDAYLPWLADAIGDLRISRIVPAIGLYLSLYLLFYSLTPKAYRSRRYPKWPGALTTAAWWVGVTVALPPAIRSFFSYDAT